MEQELTYTTLSKISESIDDLENSTINDKIVQIYLNIRMNEHDSVRRSVYALRLKYGSALVEPIEWFHCIYCYHMMEKVYSTIIAQSDISTQYYRCVDGVGLTPLHYAIILKNDRAVKKLLKNTSWGIPSPYPCTKEFSRMYDYEILGCGKQVDSIHDLLQKFNENVIDIVQMEKTLKADLRFKNVAYALQKTNLTAYHLEYAREMANQSRRENIADISERIDNLREIVDSTKESIEDIESVLMECDDLLIAAMEDAICSNLEFLEQAQKSKDPITRYLYRLYFEPDFLSRVITAVKNREDLRMYRYHSFYFVAPGFAIIDMPYQTQPNNNRDFFTQDDSREPRNNEEIPNVPLFGTSWFSPEAHHNIGVLKSEYRKLAKKYHPDSNYEAGSNHLFSDVRVGQKQPSSVKRKSPILAK